MTIDALLALCLFAFVTSITPGPSNLMLLASGANFGLWRTLPQVAGITLGFTALLLAVGLGLGAALAAWPALHIGLQAAGAAYLLHLAWRIGRSRTLGGGEAGAQPLTLLQSAAFQWVNPKAWAVAATAMAVHASPQAPVASVLADLRRLRRGQPAQHPGLGRLRPGAAAGAGRPGPAEMVQPGHGRAAGGDALADAGVTGVAFGSKNFSKNR